MTDFKNRGLGDIFIACIDGLPGFAKAIHAANPEAKVQLCIVHLVRAALRYVSTQNSKALSLADTKSVRRLLRRVSKSFAHPTTVVAAELNANGN